jgi:hypothetical protein
MDRQSESQFFFMSGRIEFLIDSIPDNLDRGKFTRPTKITRRYTDIPEFPIKVAKGSQQPAARQLSSYLPSLSQEWSAIDT